MSGNPFADPEAIWRNGVRVKDIKPVAQPTAPSPPALASPSLETQIAKTEAGTFIFADLPYQGRLLEPVEFSAQPLEGSTAKSFADWQQYGAANTKGWCVPDSELLYQVLRRVYGLRTDAQYAPVAQACVKPVRRLWSRGVWTATHVSYAYGQDATLAHTAPFPGPSTHQATLPELTRYNEIWSYGVLAAKQPAAQLGAVAALAPDTEAALRALLGDGAAEAGAVFQYAASQVGKNLREVRFWTPTQAARPCERGVACGVDYVDWFNLDARSDLDGNGPAFGVRRAKNFLGKSGVPR